MATESNNSLSSIYFPLRITGQVAGIRGEKWIPGVPDAREVKAHAAAH